jgi:hypothetical protein
MYFHKKTVFVIFYVSNTYPISEKSAVFINYKEKYQKYGRFLHKNERNSIFLYIF